MLERRDGKIDLVVSDVVMPEMDGPTLFKELRQRNPDLKIIFVSGYAEEAFSKSLPEGGQFTFLAKPFTLKQLVATVKETIDGEARRNRRERSLTLYALHGRWNFRTNSSTWIGDRNTARRADHPDCAESPPRRPA